MNTLDPESESNLLVERCKIDYSVASKMVALARLSRKNYKDQKSLTYVSTRTLLQWADLVASGITLPESYEICIVNKARSEERSAFRDYFGAIFKTLPPGGIEDDIIFIKVTEDKRRTVELNDAKNVAARVMNENLELKKLTHEFKREAIDNLKAENNRFKVTVEKMQEIFRTS
jgi:hypothetical protein